MGKRVWSSKGRAERAKAVQKVIKRVRSGVGKIGKAWNSGTLFIKRSLAITLQ